MPDLEYTLGINPGSTSKVLDGIRNQLIGLGVVAFAGGILKRGLEFNQTMYDGEKAVSKIIQQFQGLNAAAADNAAARAMQQLVDLEPKVAGGLADLVNGFVSTAAASASVGISTAENIDLVGKFANVLGGLKMPIDQVGQELRSILTGNIGADSQVAKTLGITNEMAEAAKNAGNLYGLLNDKLGLMGQASDNAASRFSSFQSAVDKLAGALASGLFEQALDGSVRLTDSLNENIESARTLGSAIASLTAEISDGIAVIGEWGKAWKISFGMYADMLFNGTSEVEAMANAEDELTDAVNEQGKAATAAAVAISAADAMRAKSAKETAAEIEATKKRLGTGAEPETKAVTTPNRKEEKPEHIADEILTKQEKLNDLKRQSAEDEMSSAEKIASLRERIAAAAEYEATIKSIDVAGDPRVALDAETKRVELARELAQLLREEARAEEELAKKAQDKTEQQRKQREQMAGARNDLMGELAILKEQAAGHDKKAAAIQREMDIEKEKQAIIAKTGASEADALRMAKEKAGYEDRIAKRKERNSNRDEQQGAHIGGVTRRTMMGGSSEGAFADLQKSTSRFDALQNSNFGAGALAPSRDSSDMDPMGRASRGGVDSTSRQMSKLMGQTNTTPLSGRIAAATTNAPPKPPGPAKVEQDPAVGKLDQILSELTRIRTT